MIQAGDSDGGRELAAEHADVIFSRHSGYADGQAFYADVKRRLARYGRRRDDLKIIPAATAVVGDTDADAEELAAHIRLQQVSPQGAIAFVEQVWGRDLSGYDPDGPLPDVDPDVDGSDLDHPRPGPPRSRLAGRRRRSGGRSPSARASASASSSSR